MWQRRFRRVASVGLALALLWSITTTFFTSASAVASSPNPGPSTNELRDVYARSATDAWAVGYFVQGPSFAYRTLALHWNGVRWARVWTPNPSSYGVLNAVSGTAASRVWAVGYYESPTGPSYKTLILRWNGTDWVRVPSPNPGSSINLLNDITVISGTDAWAVGEIASDGGYRTLTLHWDGVRWSRVPSPNGWCATCSLSEQDSELGAVGAISPTDVWAGGVYVQYPDDGKTDTLQSFGLHWNGSRWNKVRLPDGDGVTSLSGISSTDVWAGTWAGLLHWDGASWTYVPSVPFSSMGVDQLATTDAWAAGNGVIAHWDGVAWSPSWSAADPCCDTDIAAIDARTPTDVWAAGDVRDPATHVTTTLILHWNGVSWTRT